MFIRATKTGTTGDGSRRLSHRLATTMRIGKKVQQNTLLNLGVHFTVDRLYWSRLCQRIEELTSGQSALVELGLTPDVEAEAQRIAACLRENTASEPGLSDDDPCYERVEESSVRDSDGRSIGTEQAVLEALKALRFPELLKDLGFNRRQHACALANIIGRMVFPASEHKTAIWLRNNSAACELPGVNPNRINEWPSSGG